ncbi:MAG: hypothetical protein AMXMBFR72_11860 [Betaproteobacteria bacterium]
MSTPELIIRPQEDEIRYRVVAQRTIVQEDARVAVPVTLLVSTAQLDQSELDRRIRGALKRFIDADWVFSLVRRDGEAVGYERVTLTAWARVPHREVFNLNERARRASSEGLSLGEPEIDYALPFARLNQVAHELRAEIIEQIKQHQADFAAWTGRAWRIGSIGFGAASGLADRRTSKGTYRSDDDVAFSMALEARDANDATAGVTGAERIGIVAEVVLRASSGVE